MLEALDDRLFADAGGHREGADVVGKPARARRDEIGERHIGAAFAARELLAQRVQRGDRLAARFVVENQNVVALAVRRPQSDHRIGAEPALGDDLAQHRLRIGEQAARRFADHLVVEDRGIFAVELPGGEERRPVDEVDELGDRQIGEVLRAEKFWHRRPVIAGPVEFQRIGARVGERQPLLVLLAARVRRGDAGIFGAHVVDVALACHRATTATRPRRRRGSRH